jgi:hypothetical protein
LHDAVQQESLELCITLDSAGLCKGLSHLSLKVKITDKYAINPRDSMPLSQTQDGIFGNLFTIQALGAAWYQKGRSCPMIDGYAVLRTSFIQGFWAPGDVQGGYTSQT